MDVKDFIDASIDGNAVEAQQALNDVISSRAMDALSTRKTEIAQTLYSGHVVEEEVEQIDELTGKGQLPAIKKSHADAASAAGSKMDTIRNSNFKLPVPKEKTSKIYGLASAKQYHTHQSTRADALMKKAGIK